MLTSFDCRFARQLSLFALCFAFIGTIVPEIHGGESAQSPHFIRKRTPLPAEAQAATQPRLDVLSRATGLVITPNFGTSITNNARAADIMATINSAIAFYQSKFSDNVTVVIQFENVSSGLGMSNTFTITKSYSSIRSALAAQSHSADDNTALAHLPSQTNEPVTNNANISITTANARALGFNASSGAGNPDSTISLNAAICNILPSEANSNKYSLFAVTCHEIDEALGLGSSLDFSGSSEISIEDLFRYDGSGNRSSNSAPNAVSYFSIDGTTQIVQFNQTPGADRGDWFSPGGQTPRVQDAFATPGSSPVPAEELRALDVIGWTLSSQGPPSTVNLAADTSVSFTYPNTVTVGKAIAVSAAVKNTGTSASGAFSVRFAFSTSITGSTSDVTIGSSSISGLAAGASVPVSFSGNCPWISVGSYFVIMTIDPANAVVETNENDNVSASSTKVAVSASNALPPVIGSAANATPNPTMMGQSVTFSVSATDPSNTTLTYMWDFGDGTIGSGASTTHAYTNLGTFNAVVTVADTLGAFSTSNVSVLVALQVVQADDVKKSFGLGFTSGSDKIDVVLFHDSFFDINDGTAIGFVIGDPPSGKSTVFDTGTLSRGKGFGNLGKFALSTRNGTLRYTATRVQLQSLLAQFGAGNTSGTAVVPIYFQIGNGYFGGTYSFSYTVRGNNGTGR